MTPATLHQWKSWNHDWYSVTTTSTSASTTSYYDNSLWTSAATTTTSDRIWVEWQRKRRREHATTYRVTYNTSWESWNADYTTSSLQRYAYVQHTPAPVLSPEQRRERDERRRREAEARRVARRTAHQLLMTVLDDEQALQYDLEKQFITTGSDGQRYLLTLGREHNVFVLDAQGNRIEELCGHVRDYVPDEDNLVAQKLLIECDAPSFRRVCNIWDLRRPGRPIIHHSGAPLPGELAVA